MLLRHDVPVVLYSFSSDSSLNSLSAAAQVDRGAIVGHGNRSGRRPHRRCRGYGHKCRAPISRRKSPRTTRVRSPPTCCESEPIRSPQKSRDFQKTVQQSVEVGVNQSVRIDLVLKVGSASETVEVTAAPALLQTEASSLGTIETAEAHF